MQITKNFTVQEFACKDGTPVPVKYTTNMIVLAYMLQVMRGYFNAPITIQSGYRTVSHNTAVGGASRSFHLYCMAADIVVKGYTSDQVYTGVLHLIQSGKIIAGGIKNYSTFVHYDIRGTLTNF